MQFVAEYIWNDVNGEFRSKSRTVTAQIPVQDMKISRDKLESMLKQLNEIDNLIKK